MSIEPKVKFVDLSRQYRSIKAEVDAAMGQVLDHTDFILGDDVQQFEREFAEYCQAEEAVGVDNGTSALELALRALGIGPGDEVLVPVNTFMASASAISFTGATPVFVDCDPVTYNIDVEKLEQCITPHTRAIMPVHLYGQPADIDPILEIARVHRLYVVEDACQAHGARYKGHRVGSLGHIGAFSFYPGKNLGAYGDGGAIVTNDRQLAERVRILRNCGQREKYNHVTLAYNRRLDTLQAAVLRVKLRYLDQWNSMRRHWSLMYNQLLEHEDVDNITTPRSLPYVDPVHHLYVIRVRERSTLQAYMAGQGFAAGIHYPVPIHLQPAYRDLHYKPGDFPVAERYAATLLSLPMFAELEYEEVEAVVACIHEFYQNLRQTMLIETREEVEENRDARVTSHFLSPQVNPGIQ
jgi:dTDP-4-amino-4,6-dideoxygalactose transaminase